MQASGGVRRGGPMERWIRPRRWRRSALERIFFEGVQTDKVASGDAASVGPRTPPTRELPFMERLLLLRINIFVPCRLEHANFLTPHVWIEYKL